MRRALLRAGGGMLQASTSLLFGSLILMFSEFEAQFLIGFLLSGGFRLSKRLTVELLANLYGIPISLGSISACEQVASEAVVKPVEEARAYVQEQSVKRTESRSCSSLIPPEGY